MANGKGGRARSFTQDLPKAQTPTWSDEEISAVGTILDDGAGGATEGLSDLAAAIYLQTTPSGQKQARKVANMGDVMRLLDQPDPNGKKPSAWGKVAELYAKDLEWRAGPLQLAEGQSWDAPGTPDGVFEVRPTKNQVGQYRAAREIWLKLQAAALGLPVTPMDVEAASGEYSAIRGILQELVDFNFLSQERLDEFTDIVPTDEDVSLAESVGVPGVDGRCVAFARGKTEEERGENFTGLSVPAGPASVTLSITLAEDVDPLVNGDKPAEGLLYCWIEGTQVQVLRGLQIAGTYSRDIRVPNGGGLLRWKTWQTSYPGLTISLV